MPEIINIEKLFENTFGNKPYKVPELTKMAELDPYKDIATKADEQFSNKGSLVAEQYRGVEIFLPVSLFIGSEKFYLPYCVVKMGFKSNYIKTPLNERKGTVKEQFAQDDDSITIKGFVISDDKKFPEKELERLDELRKSKAAITLDNALTNIFLTDNSLPGDEQRRVVIDALDIMDVQGGRINVRPFTMQLSSDSIFILELQ